MCCFYNIYSKIFTYSNFVLDARWRQMVATLLLGHVRVHGASRPAANRALAQLFDHLNNARVKYPGTELQMIFELGGLTTSDHAEGVT